MNKDIYDSPKANLIEINKNSILFKLPMRELQILYKKSKKLRLLQSVWFVLFVIFSVTSFGSFYYCYSTYKEACNIESPVFILIFSVIFLVCSLGCYKRTIVSYYTVLIFSIIHLFVFPIGTAIGIYGLLGLIKGKKLFGLERASHIELKTFLNENLGTVEK